MRLTYPLFSVYPAPSTSSQHALLESVHWHRMTELRFKPRMSALPSMPCATSTYQSELRRRRFNAYRDFNRANISSFRILQPIVMAHSKPFIHANMHQHPDQTLTLPCDHLHHSSAKRVAIHATHSGNREKQGSSKRRHYERIPVLEVEVWGRVHERLGVDSVPSSTYQHGGNKLPI